jgi:hypothetical protein
MCAKVHVRDSRAREDVKWANIIETDMPQWINLLAVHVQESESARAYTDI